MMAGEIERLFVSLQTCQHEAAFERTGNQCGQFQGIDVRADFASASPLVRNQLATIKPRTEGLSGFRSQLPISNVGMSAPLPHPPSSPLPPPAPVPTRPPA